MFRLIRLLSFNGLPGKNGLGRDLEINCIVSVPDYCLLISLEKVHHGRRPSSRGELVYIGSCLASASSVRTASRVNYICGDMFLTFWIHRRITSGIRFYCMITVRDWFFPLFLGKKWL